MNTDFADFLPPGYRANLRRRRSRIVKSGLSVATAAVLAALTFFSMRERDDRSAKLTSISNQYQHALSRIAEVEELQGRKEELNRQLMVLRDVLLRTPGSEIVQAVVASCPESTTRNKVDVRLRDSGARPEVDIVVEGQCPDHIDAARFMRAMNDEPLLRTVRMVKSEKIDAYRDDKKFLITAQSPGLIDGEEKP